MTIESTNPTPNFGRKQSAQEVPISRSTDIINITEDALVETCRAFLPSRPAFRSFTAHDLANVGGNAFLQHAYFRLPEAVGAGDQAFSPPDSFTIEKYSSSRFFPYLVNKNNLEGVRSIQTTRKEYYQYLETLQEAARIIAANPDRHIPPIADLRAILAAESLEAGQETVNGYPMLSCEYRQGYINEIRSPFHGDAFGVPLREEGLLYIPGAGITTVSNMISFSDLNPRPVFLNDRNRYVNRVLDGTARRIKANNVHVQEGSFTDLNFDENSVSQMIISLLQIAGEAAIDVLLGYASRFMTKDGEIVAVNPDNPPEENAVTSNRLATLFTRHGFRFTTEPGRVESAGLLVRDTDPPFYEMKAETLIQLALSSNSATAQHDKFTVFVATKA